jgi:ribonuclease Y
MNDVVILILAAFLLVGVGIGAAALMCYQKLKLRTVQHLANEILQKAEIKAESLREHAALELKGKQTALQNEFEKLWVVEKKKLGEKEERFKQKEDKLEERINLVEKKISDIERREALLLVKKEQFELEKQNLHEREKLVIQELERISGLTSIEAKELLTSKITDEVKSDAANFIRRITKEAEEDAERKASTIIATAINRLAVPCVSEATVNTVALPNDEMKGRIIG